MVVPLWSSAGIDIDTVKRVADTYRMPVRVARVLCSRVGEDEIPQWLRPETIPFRSPYLFSEMTPAVTRVHKAIAASQRIAVIGDYDVDGVTATTILATTLEALGADYRCYIPHRVDDGYGLSEDLIDRAVAGGCQLVVTVDNGIRAVEAVRYARQQAIDVIVTDHHEPGDDWPDEAIAVLHHALSDDRELSVLSGAGVAWKFAEALLEETHHSDLQRWHLGLATLGAFADVMPMRAENRRLVREGLEVLRSASKPGWLALCQVAGVNPSSLTETSILWSITPRINAAGRMDSAELALALLLATTESEAMRLAGEVELKNEERRRETTRATAGAQAAIEATYADTGVPPVIVVAGEWPLGVVGIVAAKLSDTYGRPAIVFADDGNHLLRGSGRSPEGIPLHEAVSRCSHLLEHFGGHSTALGCGISRENLESFRTALIETMQTGEHTNGAACDVVTSEHGQSVDGEDGSQDLQFNLSGPAEDLKTIADDYLPLHEATLEAANWLVQLGPYGPGYAPYRFYVGPVELVDVTPMGQGRHLRLTIREGRNSAKLIWFSPPKWAFHLSSGTTLAAIVNLEVNTWQGRQQAQLRAETVVVLSKPVLREDFAMVYRLLQARRKVVEADVRASLPTSDQMPIQTIFDTFVDLGFAYLHESEYHVVEQAQARDLRESIVYQSHLREVAVQPEAMGQ